MRLGVQADRAHVGAGVLDDPQHHLQRAPRVGDVVHQQHALALERHLVEERREDDGLVQAGVHAGVELGVQRAAALHVERVGDRPGAQQAAARDRDDPLGLAAAAVHGSGQLARPFAEVVPGQDLAFVSHRETLPARRLSRRRACGR